MWKALLLLAYIASVDFVVCNVPPATPYIRTTTEPDDDCTEPPVTIPTTPPPDDDCSEQPPKCGYNEVYNNCTNTGCRAYKCSELGFPLKCNKKCKPGCICKGGYVYNEKDVCIPIKNCMSCGGDKNAESGCGNNCGKTCASYNKKPVLCTLACRLNGCDCRDGFVYDSNVKACVRPKDCTPVCKKNEQYSPCTNGGCDARNCSQLGRPVPCVKLDPKDCIKGCVCVDGYLRAPNGTCVPKDQCGQYPPICGKNQVYNNCTYTGCTVTRCSQLGYPFKCDKCTPGCICKDDYVRADNDTCIPKLDCPSCGGDKNAQQGCGSNCGRTCSTYNKPPIPCPPSCIFNGCTCKPGFVYDNNIKACVKPNDCSPICNANEQYSPCINGGCDARNCSQLGRPVPCVKLDPKACIKGCVCVDGYLRAPNGTCVPKDQCTPKCDKPDEVYDFCPAPCPPKWCNINEALIRCKAPPKPGDPECQPGCRCADTYYRNATGICVPKKKCEKPLKCDGPNEVYNPCPGICPLQECGINSTVIFCPRNPVYGDPGCRPSCVCIDGFVRNKARKCIPKDQCPPVCKKNEQYSPCTNGGCDARNCSQLGRPVPCVKLDPKDCIKGCVCVDGYLRAPNGTCVPKDQCGQCNGDPNAHPGCGVNCGRTCATYKSKGVACPAICNLNGCDCNDGYVYDNIAKKCVWPKDCSGCGGDPNAQPGCGYNCGNTCSTYKINKQLLCPRIQCKPDKCDCKKGYVLDQNVNKCVLIKDCTPTCGLNEVYSSCINGGCGYKNCSQIGKPKICVDPAPGYCIKGCVCASGYLRAPNGTCVLQDQCPKTECKGDPNAHPGCGVNCGRTCATYKTKNVSCILSCDLNGCDCNDGYVYDDIAKKCVWPKDCTPTCGLNEVYSSCINGGCGYKNCSQIGQPKICVDPAPGYCIKGCVCASGYLRAPNGTCVPQDQCPKTKCKGDPNAHPGCGVNCGRTCATYKTKVVACILSCDLNGCDCNDGYVYDDIAKKCVLPKDCTPTCKVNEQYSTCANGGCGPKNCSQLGDKMTCLTPVTCTKGCICIDGYLKDSNGTCIPKDKCPPTCTGQNEYLDTCIQGCSNQSCATIGQTFNCPNQPAGVCKTGCRCNPGFFRNDTNVCVSQDKCPKPDCPEGSIWDWCPTIKCDGDYCPKTRDSPQTCPIGIVCDKPRCVCSYNRKKDWKTGKCIPIPDCPKFKCGKNEEYQPCPGGCPGEKCTDYINKTKCPPFRIGIIVNCRPQCKCIKGYYRNANGDCIPACDCPTDCAEQATDN